MFNNTILSSSCSLLTLTFPSGNCSFFMPKFLASDSSTNLVYGILSLGLIYCNLSGPAFSTILFPLKPPSTSSFTFGLTCLPFKYIGFNFSLSASSAVKFILCNLSGSFSGIFLPLPVIVTPKFFSSPKPGATIPPPIAPAPICLVLVFRNDSSSTYPAAPATLPDTIPKPAI